MSFSRHLGPLQVNGILKAGDILVPGGGLLPAFSSTGSIVNLDRILDYLNETDRSGLKAVALLFGVLPRFMVFFILTCAASANRFPGPLAVALRQLHIGVKGVIMSLYYSDPTLDGRIHREIGWDAKCGDRSSDSAAKQAFDKAREGHASLRKLSVKERLRFIRALRAAVLANEDRIVDEIQKATGKSRTDALTSEIFGVLDHLVYLEKFAERQLRERKVHTPPVLMGKKSVVRFEPLGTILVISPWNYPFYQAIVPITSAFVCGNTVVYKPSEYTPLPGLVEKVLSEAGFSANWVQVVYGTGEVGRELIEQRPQKIFFTGSARTGSKIMEQAAKHLIPVELELGGKDPMVVFADANLDRAVAGAAWGGLTNTGQSCTSVERILVEERIYDRFRSKLVEEVSRLTQKVDADGAGALGLMTNDMQVAIVAEHLQDALSKGAKLLTGENWDRKSRAIPPLVLDGVTPGMKIYYEETFGPVLPLVPFSTEAEAIRMANDSEYGLSASVWSADLDRANRVADAIVTGNVSINNVMITEGNHALPFGGTKNSGFGRYKGEFGLFSFSNVKAVMIEKSNSKIEANWYPYTPEKYRLFQRLIRAVFAGGPLGLLKFAIAGLKLEGYTAKLRSKKPARPESA